MSGRSPEVRRVDADGVVRVERVGRRGWLIPLGAAVFGGVAIALAWMAGAEEPEPSPEPPGEAAQAGEAVRLEPAARAPRPARAPPPAATAARPPAAAPTAPEPQEEASPEEVPDDPEPPPEIRTGMALFPPPGTKPIKRGIIVPDDFDLPSGYVRHYQSTDDGQQLPPILMFHPDYRPVDAQGQPAPVPKDRVVPPELAPPGMPIHMLASPGSSGEGGEGP